jgi:hypothetical protein
MEYLRVLVEKKQLAYTIIHLHQVDFILVNEMFSHRL